MASNEIRGVVGVSSNRQDAEYTVRALVEIAGFARNKLSVVAWESEMATNPSLDELFADNYRFFANNQVAESDYLVILEGSSTDIAQAQDLLKGSEPKKENIFDSYTALKVGSGRRVLDISRIAGF